MQSWIIYGIVASFLYGASIIAAKVAISNKYSGLTLHYTSLFMLIGIAIGFLVFMIYSWYSGNFKFSLPDSKGIIFAVIAGLLWFLGMVASLIALKSDADVAKLTPLYNTNTLVAVLLGIFLLHELPSANEALRVIVGAIFIVVGAVLVSL